MDREAGMLISEPWHAHSTDCEDCEEWREPTGEAEGRSCLRSHTNHGSGGPEASEGTLSKRQEWPAPRGQVNLVDVRKKCKTHKVD